MLPKNTNKFHNSIEPAPLGIEPEMIMYRKLSIATGIKSGCHVIDCLVKSFCVVSCQRGKFIGVFPVNIGAVVKAGRTLFSPQSLDGPLLVCIWDGGQVGVYYRNLQYTCLYSPSVSLLGTDALMHFSPRESSTSSSMGDHGLHPDSHTPQLGI